MSGLRNINRFIGRITPFLILLMTFISPVGLAQSQETEEIVVKLEIPRLMQKDIFVLYDGTDIYVSLNELFALLEINIKEDFLHGVFSGEYLTPDNKYEINLSQNRAKCFGQEMLFDSTSYIVTEYNLYVKLKAFEQIFNLQLFFNFSELNIYMPLEKDFPIYQRLKRQQDHKILRETKVALKDVYEIKPEKEIFSGGVVDWMVSSNPFSGGDTYLNLGIGSMILNGDLAISGTGSMKSGLNQQSINYKWHYVFDNRKYITQAEVGNINSGNYLARGLKGVLITNRPQIRRKHFQTISLSDRIGPGWEVELYVNNKLVDFTTTDNNGEYNFLVDTEYGRTKITLKMYGPNGEIRTEEKLSTVPFNIIPKKDYEYTIAGGQTTYRDTTKNYIQVNGLYGLFGKLTVGLSSDMPVGNDDGEKPTTAIEGTFQPLSNTLVSASYSPNYAMQLDMSMRNVTIASVTARYVKYYENQFRNPLGQQNSLSVSVSSPVKFGKNYIGLRCRYSRDIYPTYRTSGLNIGVKLMALKTNLNYIGNFSKTIRPGKVDGSSISKIILSSSLLNIIRPQIAASYDHSTSKISKMGIYFHKRIFRQGQLSLSLEDNRAYNSKSIMLTFNISTDFADFTSRGIYSNGSVGFNQMQKGSVRYNQHSKSFRFVKRNGIGAGSAVVSPFVDDNYNGILDHGETILSDLKTRIGGASVIRNRDDKVSFYDNLRPYDPYLVEIDQYSLDNPMLTPAHENYRVILKPNTVTAIHIPVVTAGEIGGKVDRKITDGSVGIGGIRLIVVNEKTGKETELITFNSGEYFHIGLVPGMYRAYIDPTQLERYGYEADPPYSRFQIKTIAGGDYVGNINFMIEAK